MTRHSLYALLLFVFGFTLCGAPRATAQPADATTQPPDTSTQLPDAAAQPPPDKPADNDDDGKLRPMEPDFTVVNLPTTLPLPRGAGNFHLTHRFNENLRRDDFGTQASNLWGLDQGATIQLEYRYGVAKHLEAIVSRTNIDRDIQFSAKYDAFHQDGAKPFGLSAIVSVEGGNNFRERYTPTVGLSVSRSLGNVIAVYVDPIWAHNTLPGAAGDTLNTFYVGVGARLKIRPSTFIVGEVTPRLGGYTPGDAEFAFALEKRVGAHVFSLTFANAQATTYGQLARGGSPETLYLGFNLARKFF